MIQAPILKASQFILSALAIVCLGYLIFFAHFGLNFTDEGFYLNMIANVGAYPGWAMFQYDFVLAPIFALVREDIVKLRIVNLLASFLLAWGAFLLVFVCHRDKHRLPRIYIILLSSTLSASVFFAFSLWLTPSYNSVAMAGSILYCVGLIICFSGKFTQSKAVSISLICMGISLGFAGKITTGIGLSLILLTLIVFTRSYRYQLFLGLGGGLILWIALASFNYGGFEGFINQLSFTAEILNSTDQRHTLLYQIQAILSEIILGFPWKAFLYAFISQAILFAFAFWLIRKVQIVSLSIISLLLVIGLASVLCHLMLFYPSLSSIAFDRYVMLSIWLFAFVFSYTFFVMVMFPCLFRGGSQDNLSLNVPSIHDSLTRGELANQFRLSCGLIFIPFAYAFGTDIGLWVHVYGLSIVYVLAFLNLFMLLPNPWLMPRHSASLLAFISASVLIVSFPSVAHAVQRPHLQQSPLWLNRASVSIHQNKSQLKVSSSVAAYLTTVEERAYERGFAPGTPFLDFGAWKPTLAYVLSGRAIVSPWILAGSTDSNRALAIRFSKTSCEDLSSAWILIQPDSYRMPPLDLLADVGISLNDTEMYEKVLEIPTPPLNQGFTPPGIQVLYKPLQASSVNRLCKSIRNDSL